MAAISNLLLSPFIGRSQRATLSPLVSAFLERNGKMDDTIRIDGVELGLVLEKQGEVYVIRTRRGGISTFVQFWLAGMFPEESVGDFNPAVFEQELREALDTPDGWRQLRGEEGVHRLEMALLRKMSADQLAAYLKQCRVRYQKLFGIDTLNQDILWRIVAKGGDIVGLPTALKKVLDEGIQRIAQHCASSKYVDSGGTPRTLIYHAGKGIGRGLENLDQCRDSNIVEFLLAYVETAAQEAYDRKMNPKQKTGKRDVLDHPKELVPWDKPLQKDPSVYPQREDEDRKDSHVLTIEDEHGGETWDEEIKALIKLGRILEQLPSERRRIITEEYLENVPFLKGARERARRSRARRDFLKRHRAIEAILKESRG